MNIYDLSAHFPMFLSMTILMRSTHFLQRCLSVLVIVCQDDQVCEVDTVFLKRCVSISVVNLKGLIFQANPVLFGFLVQDLRRPCKIPCTLECFNRTVFQKHVSRNLFPKGYW